MSKSNIIEVKKLSVLKEIMETRLTVILGFTIPHTPDKMKIIIRRFLKRKSEIFPLITFIYMEVLDNDRSSLNILKGEPEDYPKIYHIRGGNNILVSVQAATEETLNESFEAAEPFYLKEMNEKENNSEEETKKNLEQDKKKNLEKLVLLNKMCDDVKLNTIKDISMRKKLESIIDKNKDSNVDDGKEYRKNIRKKQ